MPVSSETGLTGAIEYLPLFAGEVRLAENSADLDHVALVGGAPQRPLHTLFS
jgi:hypothetical protein